MEMTFKEMYTQVGQLVADTGTSRQVLIKDAINRHYLRIAKELDWPQIMAFDDSLITKAAGDDILYMPKRVWEVKKIISDVEPRVLENVNMEMLIQQHSTTLDEAGNSEQYSILGMSPVSASIASAERMDFVSSNSGDTIGITIELRGISGVNELTESITINGTTTVTSTNSYSRITQVSVDGTRSGVITMDGMTSGTVYSTISPRENASEYLKVRLHPVRAATETFTVLYKIRIMKLVRDGDVPVIPVSEALIELAAATIFENMHKWSPANVHRRNGVDIVEGYRSMLLQQSENIMITRPFPWRASTTTRIIRASPDS